MTKQIRVYIACAVPIACLLLLWRLKAKRIKDTEHVKEFTNQFHWLFGHSFIIASQLYRILDFATERFEALGVDTAWWTLGSTIRLSTRDPKVVKHFMKDNFSNYVKGSFFTDTFEELLGNGIFTSDGKQWQLHRKTASNLFTKSRLQDQMTLSFCESADRLVEKCGELSEGDNSVDMFDLFNRLTLEAFVKVAFGHELNVINAAPDVVPFQKAFDQSQHQMMIRSLTPPWFWKLMKILNIGGEAEFKRSVAILDDFVKTVKDNKKNGESDQPDLLSLFLDEGKRYSRNEPSFREVKDIMLNFIIAGRDTTAQTLTWVTYMLARRPDVYKRVMDEVKANQALTWYKRAEKMTYTHAVISETLRLFPIVASAVKTALKDDTLPNGFKVPAGTIIFAFPYCMGRNPNIWGKDARCFRPERWLGERLPPDHEFLSFNTGRRTCLEKNFAYLEIKIVLTKFLERYTVRLDDSRFNVALVTTTLPAREGLHCYLDRVDDSSY